MIWSNVSGDGCDKQCKIEPGWECAGQGAFDVCSTKCGDGKVLGQEQCDDGTIHSLGCVSELVATGNQVSGDGCSSVCEVETGYSCDGLKCSGICGDRRIRGDETCDDGNNKPGDPLAHVLAACLNSWMDR